MYKEIPRGKKPQKTRPNEPRVVIVTQGFVHGRKGRGRDDALEVRLGFQGRFAQTAPGISLAELRSLAETDDNAVLAFRNDGMYRAVLRRIGEAGFPFTTMELASYSFVDGDLVVVLPEARTFEFQADTNFTCLRICRSPAKKKAKAVVD